MNPLTTVARFLTHSPPLTLSQVGILLACQGPERKSLSDLSATLSRSETLIGVAVSKLASWGLLVKTPDLSDLRKYFVTLSPQGHALVRYATQE